MFYSQHQVILTDILISGNLFNHRTRTLPGGKMPLLRIILAMLFSIYSVAWWHPRMMYQLSSDYFDDTPKVDSVVVDWLIDRVIPKILWIICFVVVYSALSSNSNSSALAYVLGGIVISVLVLGKPSTYQRYSNK